MTDINQSDEFVELISSFQGRLYGFILSMMGDPDQANDVLQETNIVLWKKSGEFSFGTSFKSWSFRVASFQVMAYRQKKLRDRLVFDDSLFSSIIAESQEIDELFTAKQKALDSCIQKLNDRHRELIDLRYCQGTSVKRIAEELNQKANAITQTLFRARKNLIDCVKRNYKDGVVDVWT